MDAAIDDDEFSHQILQLQNHRQRKTPRFALYPAGITSRSCISVRTRRRHEFYLPPLVVFGQALAQRGFQCFVINTRGHDWISRAGNLTEFGGSAYENLEDCLPDLDGAFDYLQQQGYRRFVLIGHSLGAIKSIIYQGTRQRPMWSESFHVRRPSNSIQSASRVSRNFASSSSEPRRWSPKAEAKNLCRSRSAPRRNFQRAQSLEQIW